MGKRPEYCEAADCPYFKVFCRLDEVVKRMFPSAKGREKERDRLTDLASENRGELIQKCATIDTTVIFRR